MPISFISNGRGLLRPAHSSRPPESLAGSVSLELKSLPAGFKVKDERK